MLDIYFAILGGLALALGLASRPLREAPVSEPLVALIAGVLCGPHVIGLLDVPGAIQEPVLAIAAEISLAFAIMATTLRFTWNEIRRRVPALVLLLTVVLMAMAASSGLLAALALGLPAAGAILLGAILAPTDPVLASNAVSGEHAERDLRLQVRLLLSIESAANDGLAHLLVAVGIGVAVGAPLLTETGSGLIALVVGIATGIVLGWLVGHLVVWADRHHEMEHSAFLVLTLSLTLLILGATEAIGGTGLVAVFTAGLVYNHVITEGERRQEWEIQEAVNRYLVLPVFALFGLALPWDAWSDLGWRGAIFAAGILALRRAPVVLGMGRALELSPSEAAFTGWFGPVGVAALFYLATAVEDGAASRTVWAAGTLVIAVSTVAHGVTAATARRRLAKRHGNRADR
jgi:sodium/hydrogen antiporter